MINKAKVETNPLTGKVFRYPWHMLKKIGDVLELECPQPYTARDMAYRIGKSRGWKVSGKIVGRNCVHLMRVQ